MNNPAINQWISVKERLPKNMRPVFCYDCNGNPGVAFLSNGVWLRDALDPADRYQINVTHWLESEPPPKPDPFDEWWNNKIAKISRPAFSKEFGREIWDAAVNSVMKTDH